MMFVRGVWFGLLRWFGSTVGGWELSVNAVAGLGQRSAETHQRIDPQSFCSLSMLLSACRTEEEIPV
jgi:hypothetical protein